METVSKGAGGISPSHRVIAVAAGEAHSLALTGDGKVYAWGRGMFGRLGTGSEADELSPVRVKFDDSDESTPKVVGVAAGAYHSLCVADDGSVWCWGYNIYGQVGFSGENSTAPRMMDKFTMSVSSGNREDDSEGKSSQPLKFSMVKAGGMMSLAIDKRGILWMWGSCPLQENGNSDGFALSSSSIPLPVRDFQGRTVVKVACGNEHVVALVNSPESSMGDNLLCYSWGGNSHGQLGLGDSENRSHPEIVTKFSQDTDWAVYEIACGAFHTAWLARKKLPIALTECVCCGLGENGQLGLGTTQSSLVPESVKGLPQNVHLTSVDCGLFHTSVVSSDGDVWSWGMERGLGLCPDACFSDHNAGDAIVPILIGGLRFHDPVQVACGAAHTLLVANELRGVQISWGQELVTEKKKLLKTRTPFKAAPKLIKDSLALEEIKALQTKLSTIERYAMVLHGSIFGRPLEEQDIPASLRDKGDFDIAGAWESMLESADRGMLVRLEGFYRRVLAGVKDQLLKRRIKEIIQESLQSGAQGNGRIHS
ncbi:hypothetical protein MLD38_006044 [Melastoma candidum]|uniref:Uncharacterized protein n=1 Tax=Melastoma candidum TaxID=119954 RepID=A0ACB9RMX1_9MYRT|nr:hypothetical protein MLD38_006044 [Melastoma candidum]